MTELEAKHTIEELIRVIRIMKLTTTDKSVLDSYLKALDIAYSKLNPQDLRPASIGDANTDFEGQMTIENYL